MFNISLPSVYIPNASSSSSSFHFNWNGWMDGWMELSIPSIHNWQYAAPAFIPLLHMNVNRVK
jgi:hypothetical protein